MNSSRHLTASNKPATRKTLGIFGSAFGQYLAQSNVLAGAAAAARAHNFNLIAYSGGVLNAISSNYIQPNIYKLANSQNIDALLLLTSTLMNNVDSSHVAALGDQYAVPKVSLGITLPNAVNVLVDNQAGMRAAIEHLIEVHGLRRIAFIRGPDNHEEAVARFEAYLDVLLAHDIPLDLQLTVEGNFMPEDGKVAVHILLDERKVEFDALVAANDNMAIAAMDELRRRNIAVPGQIAVVGFDDIEDASSTIPPLTTVRQPLYQQGKKGADAALALLRGETSPNDFVLDTTLVLRESCGCLRRSKAASMSEPIEATSVAHTEANRQLQFRSRARRLSTTVQTLLTAPDISHLTELLSHALPDLGIELCYIALYEPESPEWCRLVLAYNRFNGDLNAAKDMPLMLSCEVTNYALSATNKQCTLVIESLHFGGTQLGFLILDIEDSQLQVQLYEILREQLSSVFHSRYIIQRLEEKQAQLETTLEGLRTTQAMLIHSEKMNALGQMVAGVAHEINNPIAFVSSNVYNLGNTFEEFVMAYNHLEDFARSISQQDNTVHFAQLRKENGLDFLVDDTKDLIAQTLHGLKRVKDIVTELRKFSRLDEAEFKFANLRENIESTILVASGELRNRVKVELSIDPNLSFKCASAQLNQVFLNMVVNAAQAIQGEGTICISAHESNDHIVIEISDTGSGIPEHVIGHIFDPFYTTKPVGVGTGLGLAICHKIIVDSHKGSINVESKPGLGTKFIIQLPKET
jgi:signal transduction histidine kinase/DNA-binding LacI/PurR family transcriptional regulator